MIDEASDQNFAQLLPRDGYALVLFKSSTCAPCNALMPKIRELSAKKPAVKIVLVDTAKAPQVTLRNNIQSVPAPYLIKMQGGSHVRSEFIDPSIQNIEAALKRVGL